MLGGFKIHIEVLKDAHLPLMEVLEVTFLKGDVIVALKDIVGDSTTIIDLTVTPLEHLDTLFSSSCKLEVLKSAVQARSEPGAKTRLNCFFVVTRLDD